jgi:hypothetical protein
VKDIEMQRDHHFRVRASAFVHYKAGQTYRRVPEVAVRSIVAAGAGRVVDGAPRPAKFRRNVAR